MPFVRENPVLGAQVNVTGTVNVFEAAKRHGLETTIAYASSAAVYDADGDVAPSTLYGVFKLANEGTARIYAAEHGVASVGLRPVHGLRAGPRPGPDRRPDARDRRGRPRRAVPHRLRRPTQLHYAGDVARAFVQAARIGAGAAPRPSASAARATAIADFVALVEAAVPGAEITFDDDRPSRSRTSSRSRGSTRR